jgi:hypothetical protein
MDSRIIDLTEEEVGLLYQLACVAADIGILSEEFGAITKKLETAVPNIRQLKQKIVFPKQ